jgi:uncharacterized protein
MIVDESPLTRRELLALLGMGAMAAMLPGDRHALRVVQRAKPFALRDVRLLDGPFRDAQQRDLRYLVSLDPDRLLHNFRVNAGLEPKAPVYGGWESQEPWVGIRCHGHTLGHYLGAIAMMYASTGDSECARRATYIVSELRECQRARGDGLVCAFPDGSKPLDDAVAGRPFAGVPWYTMHKIFAGLRDAHVHAATPGALPVLVALADWTEAKTRGLSDAQMQKMLDTEHGGMTEVLADVSVLAEQPRYLTLAKRFAHRKVLTPLAEGEDTLDGLHSNTQIPKFVGYQRVYEIDGDAPYGAAARNFWKTITEHRSYVTGGNGDGEHFFPVTEFAKRLGSAKTMETCCTHNMLRLTRSLFADDPSSGYADYYERALYNGILASQDPESGMMTYFQATRPGYVRLFHTPEESFWCCTGTGMENHAKYCDSIYFHADDALYVNLFIPSTLTWRERRLVITQRTEFPNTASTRLTIERVDGTQPVRATFRVRRPAWSNAVSVSVNGQRVHLTADSSGYVSVQREWRKGDTVDVRLGMTLRTEPLPNAPEYVAFVYGPIVLAGRLGTEGLTRGSQLIVNERTSGNMLNAAIAVPSLVGNARDLVRRVRPTRGEPLTFETVGLGRPTDVQLAPFSRLAHERYNLYWKVDES